MIQKSELTQIIHIGNKRAERLNKAGFITIRDISRSTPTDIKNAIGSGVSDSDAEQVVNHAKQLEATGGIPLIEKVKYKIFSTYPRLFVATLTVVAVCTYILSTFKSVNESWKYISENIFNDDNVIIGFFHRSEFPDRIIKERPLLYLISGYDLYAHVGSSESDQSCLQIPAAVFSNRSKVISEFRIVFTVESSDINQINEVTDCDMGMSNIVDLTGIGDINRKISKSGNIYIISYILKNLVPNKWAALHFTIPVAFHKADKTRAGLDNFLQKKAKISVTTFDGVSQSKVGDLTILSYHACDMSELFSLSRVLQPLIDINNLRNRTTIQNIVFMVQSAAISIGIYDKWPIKQIIDIIRPNETERVLAYYEKIGYISYSNRAYMSPSVDLERLSYRYDENTYLRIEEFVNSQVEKAEVLNFIEGVRQVAKEKNLNSYNSRGFNCKGSTFFGLGM